MSEVHVIEAVSDDEAELGRDLADTMAGLIQDISFEVVVPDVRGSLLTGDPYARCPRDAGLARPRPRWASAPARSIRSGDLCPLRAVRRRWAVAGGPRKHAAIRAALVGGWVDTLVTDSATAEFLPSGPDPAPRTEAVDAEAVGGGA